MPSHIRIPLRIKFTFYIGFVALMCMCLLAGVCIAKSTSYTDKLMQRRLAQFATLKSEQIERDADTTALALNDAFQGDNLFNVMQGLYDGTKNVSVWASDVEELLKNIFATQLRDSQIFNLYDTSGSILLSMANPDISGDTLRALDPGLPMLMPLGTMKAAGNTTGVPQNASSVINEAEVAAAAASWKSKTYTQSMGPLHNLPLNFTETPDKVWSWVSNPVPLVDNTSQIFAYSLSYTQPVSHLTVEGDVQTSKNLGYITSVLDCSQYMNDSNILDFDGSLITESNAVFSILATDGAQGWRKLFPAGNNRTADRGWHPLSSFPAMQYDIMLQNRAIHDTSNKKYGSAITNTHAPWVKKGSVGFSYANVINREWFITITMPKSAVQAGYKALTIKMVGIVISDLVFVLLCAFLLTRLTTSPTHHIYKAMQLQSHPNSKNEPEKLKVDNSLWMQMSAFWNRALSVPINYFWYITKSDQASSASSATLVNDGIPEDDSSIHSRTSTLDDCVFQLPLQIEPLNRRWFVDEFDELIAEYNILVEKLHLYGERMNDEVRLRTREAHESQQRAESANKAKSIFMMNIMNELRTPMNGILGIAAVAFCEKDAPISTLKKRLETIIGSGEVLHELLQQLLNYSRQLTDDETIYNEFTMEALAQTIRNGHLVRAETKNIIFHVNVSSQELECAKIGGDFAKINIICSNLVSNALKFSDPEKVHRDQRARVSVQLSLYAATSATPVQSKTAADAILEVAIMDCGVGIFASEMKTIFDGFSQTDHETLTKPFNGTGLGLAMSKMVCDRIQGDISVYSQQDTGTMVVLRAPVTNVDEVRLDMPDVISFDSMKSEEELCYVNSRNTARIVSILVPPTKRLDRAVFPSAEKTHIRKRTSVASSLSAMRTREMRAANTSNSMAIETLKMLNDLSTVNATHFAESKAASCAVSLSSASQNTALSTAAVRSNAILVDERIDYSRMRVLIADDNSMIRGILSKFMSKLGVAQIDLAEDGKSVIEGVERAIVSGTKHSIMFMDLSMPGAGGLEVTRTIRRQLGYHCPVVAFTGHSDEKTVQACLDAGVQRVLVKPVSFQSIAAAIAELAVY